MVSGGRAPALIVAAVVALLLLLQTVADQPGIISCTAGDVSVGDNATVTCHFHRNLSKTLENFNIIHYSDTKPHGQPVLLCHWQKNKELNCLEDGVYLKSTSVETQLSVVIQSASHTASGRYTCDIASLDPITSEPCTLMVTDLLPSETKTLTVSESSTTSTERKSPFQTTAECISDCQVHIDKVYALNVSNLTLQCLVLVLIIGIFIMKIKSCSARKRRPSIETAAERPNGDEQTELEVMTHIF